MDKEQVIVAAKAFLQVITDFYPGTKVHVCLPDYGLTLGINDPDITEELNG